MWSNHHNPKPNPPIVFPVGGHASRRSAFRPLRRQLFRAELRRRLPDLGFGVLVGAIAMWMLIEIVPAFFDGRVAALTGGQW